MGNSAAYLDAEWLAEKIQRSFFGDESHLCVECRLPNLHRNCEISSLYYPELPPSDSLQPPEIIGASKTLTITFPQDEPGPLNHMRSNSPGARAKWHFLNDLYINVHDWTARRIPGMRTFRKDARKSLREGRSAKQGGGERLPFFYRNWSLHISKKTTSLELTLQLAIIFWHWGWSEPTTDDLATFNRFLVSLFRYPRKYVSAIEEVPSYLIGQWVMPEDPGSFRSYAKGMVFTLFAKGLGEKSDRFEEVEITDAAAKKSGKMIHRSSSKAGYMSLSALVRRSGVGRRQIHQAIKDGKLKAKKFGISTVIEASSAESFIHDAKRRQSIRTLKTQLEDMGMSKDAIRKSIYLHCKDRKDLTEVLQQLQSLLKKRIRRKRGGRVGQGSLKS